MTRRSESHDDLTAFLAGELTLEEYSQRRRERQAWRAVALERTARERYRRVVCGELSLYDALRENDEDWHR